MMSNIQEPLKAEIIRSRRKTLSLEIKPDGRIVVRVPDRTPLYEIKAFVAKHEDWIRKKLEKIRNTPSPEVKRLSREEWDELFDKAMKVIPERVKYYAPQIGVRCGRITIRNQKTRWGSCSAKGNLNFNCLLMLTPPEVIDSVVVHELCHLKEMNHSKKFYDEILRVYPDYKKWDKWLKQNGSGIMMYAKGGYA